MLPAELLERLFDEKKIKILKVFFSSPKEEFYLREVARAAGVSPATTYRILGSLVELKLVRQKKVKKTKFYVLRDNEATEVLSALFEEKEDPLKELVSAVSALEGVDKIILHGEATEEKINILVIGEGIDPGGITRACANIEDTYGVNVVEVSLTEQQYRQMSEMGSFPRKKKQIWPK